VTRSRSRAILFSLCHGVSVAAASSASFQAWAGPSPSGFIDNLPADMQPDPAGPGARRWVSADADLGDYDRILLEPLTIYVAPDSEEKGLSPEAFKSLSDAFRALMIHALEPAYPVVDQPGKGVLVLRPALTNVHLEKSRRGLLGITPVGMMIQAGRSAHSKAFYLEKSHLEFEVLDGGSGKRVAVFIDRAPEKSGLTERDLLSWGQLEQALDFYARRMVKRMDAARSK
jgi:hypothetical protein